MTRRNRFMMTLTVLVLGAAMTLAAQSAHSLDEQGLAKMHQGDYAGARQAFQQALQVAPKDAQTMILLGFADVWSGQEDPAMQTWANAGGDGAWGTTADVLNGLLAWRGSSFMIASNWFSECRSDQRAYALCQNLTRQMNAGAAAPPLEQWPTLIGWMSNAGGPASTGPGLRQLDEHALEQIAQNDLKGAEATLTRSIQMGPHDSVTLTVIGLLYLTAGEYAKANDTWQKAVKDPHWGNMAFILHGLLDWKQNPSSWGVNWFDLCHANAPLSGTCQSLSKQKSAHQPVPPMSQWVALAGLSHGIPMVQVAPLTPAQPAQPAAPLANAGTSNSSSSGWIRLDRSSYPANSLVQVNYGGFAAMSTLELWFAPAGSPPKTNFGSSLFLNGGHGTVKMATPTPGEDYEVRYIFLKDYKKFIVHEGPRFTMQAATMYPIPPDGHYGCWFFFWGHGIWRSSISWVAIDSPSRYREPRGYGSYIFDRPRALVRMTSGPLKGRIAHLYKDVHGRTTLLFNFGENNPPGQKGPPNIDNGDTNCYLGQQ